MDQYICNPVNLPYRFDKRYGGSVCRSMADPSLVRYRGTYYLFPSTRGFYHSPDLVTWTFVDGENLPIAFTAPDIREIDGWLVQCASGTTDCAIYRTKDPLSGAFEEVSRPFAFWDPNLFQDDDGRVYLYWGCSNVNPIWGVEMDRQTMQPIGEKVTLIEGRPDIHGWERLGIDNDPEQGYRFPGETGSPALTDPRPWIEGAWMTKHNHRYYLQYSAPGTEYGVYADGVYVSDHPLGPFTYSSDNPFSVKPGGFIPGAGHGSTLEDAYGNLWHISSMVVSVNAAFERRVGLFPCGVDRDGVLYANMNYADYPMRMPDRKVENPWEDFFPGWMLLSFRKPVTATSTFAGYPTENITDESIRTRWAAGTRTPGEQVMLDLEAVMDVRAVQINFAEHNLAALLTLPGYRINDRPEEERDRQRIRWLLEGSVDGSHWEILCDKRETDTDLPHDMVCMEEGIQLRYIRLTGLEMPFSGTFALSGLRVFGHAGGTPPQVARSVRAARTGTMNAEIEWEPVDDCDGYNVRWGTAPDKLYHSWMLNGREHRDLKLGMLSEGVDYFVSVDTFNGSGITSGEILPIRLIR